MGRSRKVLLPKISLFEKVDASVTLRSQLNNVKEAMKPPEERSGLRMVSDRNFVFIIGGYSPKREDLMFEQFWRFNLLTDQWELLETKGMFPPEMASFACCSSNKVDSEGIFVFGGTKAPFGMRCSNNVAVLKRYAKSGYRWTNLKTTGDIPIEQYGSSITKFGNTLYLIGGTTGWSYNLEVRRLDPVWELVSGVLGVGEPESWKWTLLNDADGIDGRYRHEMVVVGEEIIIIGGGTPQWASFLNELLVFDISTNEFSYRLTHPDEKYGFPSKRMSHGCVKFHNKVYIIGGCSESVPMVGVGHPVRQTRVLFDDVWELDLSVAGLWRWRKMHVRLREKVCFHGATVTQEGCIYVFGGTIDPAFEKRTDVLQRFYIQPPSLFYHSARALLKYFPNLIQITENEVIRSNILRLISSTLEK